MVLQEVCAVAAQHEVGPGRMVTPHAPHIPGKRPLPLPISRTSCPSTTSPTQSLPTNLTGQMASRRHRMTLLLIPIPSRTFLRRIPPSLSTLPRRPPHGVSVLGVHMTTRRLHLLHQPPHYQLLRSPRSCRQRLSFLGLKSHGIKSLFLLYSNPPHTASTDHKKNLSLHLFR